MASRKILTNSFILTKSKKGRYELCKHDLRTYFDDLKYNEFAKNTDSYFENV